MQKSKTVIVTGASQGIGEGVVRSFLERGYNVVATSRTITQRDTFKPSAQLKLVDGDIGLEATAKKVAETAVETFGSIDALVNNAGIFFTKSFIDYTTEDFKKLSATNLDGFIYISQFVVRQMLKQQTGGSIVSITTSQVGHPNAVLTASVPMITKGGIDTISRSLASEYASKGIRVNVVAPGIVDTPMHKDNPKDFLKSLSPMGIISSVQEIADAVVYLTEAKSVTGEVLHVDGGAHVGSW